MTLMDKVIDFLNFIFSSPLLILIFILFLCWVYFLIKVILTFFGFI